MDFIKKLTLHVISLFGPSLVQLAVFLSISEVIATSPHPCLTTVIYFDFHVLCDFHRLFVCVEVLRPSQSNGVMSSAVSYLTTRLQDRLSPLSG